MSDVTLILSAIETGDPHAAAKLLPLVYDELRKLAAARLAQEKPGQTLEATALVHEAYLRLVGAGSATPWNSRAHFFGAGRWDDRRGAGRAGERNFDSLNGVDRAINNSAANKAAAVRSSWPATAWAATRKRAGGTTRRSLGSTKSIVPLLGGNLALPLRTNSTEDRTFQLLGLAWAGGRNEAVQKSAQQLLAEQRSDGGWGQLPSMPMRLGKRCLL